MKTTSRAAFHLCSGAPAFMAALQDDLSACRSTLAVQFSTFEGDFSGEQFANLLIERARAGIEVRLVLDHYSDFVADDVLPLHLARRSALRAERERTRVLIARLADAGVVIKRTAPLGALGRYMLFRDHKKLVVIDGRVAYLGGMNVSDHNFAWNDFMVRIEGRLAQELEREFSNTFSRRRVRIAPPRAPGNYLVNQSPGRPAVLDEMLRLIDGADHSVFIETPSLLGHRIERALLQAADRDVQVTVVVPAHHNRWIFEVWSRQTMRDIRHSNITVLGYRGSGAMTHAKLLIVDERCAVVGSANLFALEAATQKELCLFSDDVELLEQLRRQATLDTLGSEPLPPPRTTFGRFSYSMLELGVDAWTRRLVKKSSWKREYT